jgi:asparagine synthase (glutamine-hydrolysing)
MISTFLGAQGAAAAALRERAQELAAVAVVDEPGLVVLAAPAGVASYVDENVACVVWGRPDVSHLRRAGGAELADVPASIAAAFRIRGTDVISFLRPPFALVLWSRRERTGFLATDQLGARSIFTTRLGHDLVFSGEIADLLAVLGRRPAPNLAVLGSWLAGRGEPRDRTLYTGVDRLAGGFLLPLGAERAAAQRYDNRPATNTLEASPGELADLLRAEVQRAVEVRIPTGATAGIFLSGGIDSASVAAAAVQGAGSERAIAISAVFPDRPDADESALISAITTRLALRERRLTVGAGGVFADALDFLAHWQVPALSPTLGFQLALQRVAAAEGATVLLDGEGGDELFGLRPYLIADALRRGRTLRAWRLAYGLGGDGRIARRALIAYGLKGAVPSWVHERRGIRGPGWLRDDVLIEFPADTAGFAWKALPGPRWSAEGRDQLTRHRERIGAHDYLRRRAAMTGAIGAHPFLEDLDLIEFALRLPPEHAFSSKHDRPVLRAAMDRELPDEVRLRTEKSYFNHLLDGALSGPDRPALEVLLGPGAEISSLVRPAFLEGLLTTPLERRGGVWSWTAWRFASAECWLRFQADPDFAQRTPGLANLSRTAIT